MLYVSANLALRGTRRQASVKVMCDQFHPFFPIVRVNGMAISSLFNGIADKSRYLSCTGECDRNRSKMADS